MATFDQIAEVRLRIKDPNGPIQFVSVADSDSIDEPAFQTGYRAEDTGVYYYPYSDPTGAVSPLPGDPEPLMISDARIEAAIDAYGVDQAVCRLLYDVMAALGQEMRIERDATGAESVQFAALRDQMAYYRDLRKQCEELRAEASGANTGRYGTSAAVEVAGGDL